MGITLREQIKSNIRDHLSNGYLALGQCLTAVGWVGGTLPELYEKDGMIDLPMADVAGGGFVVGAALMGKRPIYVIRYQGFNWYNCISILNYACKSKELWDVECPIFIRSIAMEGGIGPVAGGSHHSLYHRMPGVRIYSPMTPLEYKKCYEDFMKGSDVFYVSEHRGSYENKEELHDIEHQSPHFVLFPISITRFAAVEASKIMKRNGVRVSVYHQKELKPYVLHHNQLESLSRCGLGMVLDDDYVDGVPASISSKLMLNSDSKVFCMGLEDRTAGFAKHLDNLPPNPEQICNRIKRYI